MSSLSDLENCREDSNNKSKIWRMVNEISNRKRSSKNSVTTIVDKEGRQLTDPLHIANCLNEHFSSMGEKMAEKFSMSENSKGPLDYVKCPESIIAEFNPTTEDEVFELIQKLKNNKACGYDLISNKVLKFTCKTIAPFITCLFNSCIVNGVFPDCFKVAQVVPLFKGGDKESPTCYRPISLLPALGKLLEKIVSLRVLDHLNENNLLSENQFGFRKHFSTEYAIIDLYEKLLHNLDNKLRETFIRFFSITRK